MMFGRSLAAVVMVTSVLLSTPCDGAVKRHLRRHHKRGHTAAKSQAADEAVTSSIKRQIMMSTLEKYKSAAVKHRQQVEARHYSEQVRLTYSINAAKEEGTKLALQQSISSNEESMLETEKIYDNMIQIANALTGVVTTAHTKVNSCEAAGCGLHATCTHTMAGAQCVCNEGYVGTGYNCHAPHEFKPHLLFEGEGVGDIKAADISTCVFDQGKIAVAFRDLSADNVGRVVVGRITDSGIAVMSMAQQFTQPHEKAYDPVVQASDDKRILIAWRDQLRTGNGWVRGAALGSTGIRGADMAITWGDQVEVALNQAHKMALVSVENGRFALMYSDQLGAEHADTSFGNSLFAEVGPTGVVTKLGQYRFSDFPVCRLEVAKLSPTTFVVAARGAMATDDMDPSISIHQEALAIYGEAVGTDLVFNPNSVNLEPAKAQIWARGISLVAPHTFAYAYQDGTTPEIKMAVVRIDPTTKAFVVEQRPAVIHQGMSPYVSMLSMPYTASDPHTLVYYQSGASSFFNICTWSDKEGILRNCADITWLGQPLSSVAGERLDAGRSFMVFATSDGTPYYTVFGLSKK